MSWNYNTSLNRVETHLQGMGEIEVEKLVRDADLPNYGELVALYVDPDHWLEGVGVALVTAAHAALLQQGFRNANLWLLAGNLRADRFYQNDGWLPDGTRRTDTIWNITVDELRYQRPL